MRIEDTDQERSSKEFTEVILSSLKWIGLDWDEGPFFQSERHELYKSALERLIDEQKVYKCFCAPEELKERREKAKEKGKNFGYDGRCRNLSGEEADAFERQGIKPAYRLKIESEGKVGFKDMIRGYIEVDLATLDDFVIAKRDRSPLYNFACVVDDSDLNISHVIRGDDHIYNTHKQILIYGAMNAEVPEFAHLPQVHGKDGKKLSKRTGAVSLDEYKQNGYLPEALRNYLALLGWSTEDAQQIFEGNELIEKFDITRCSSSSGIFDTEKLDWMNGKYIRSMEVVDLIEQARPWLEEKSLISKDELPSPIMEKAVKIEIEKIRFLSEIPGKIDYIIKNDIEYDTKAVNKRLRKEGVKEILEKIIPILENDEEFTLESLEKNIKQFCESNDLNAGKVFHPLRVAVSGRMMGPGVFELLEIIGKKRVIERIRETIKEHVL